MSRASIPVASAKGPLAIIAGGGSLPFTVADAAIEAGRRVVLLAWRGSADAAKVGKYPHHWVALAQAGRIERLLRKEGCNDVVFIGNVVRPTIRDLRMDFLTLRILFECAGAMRGGDNQILRAMISATEQRGFRVVGAHEIAPHILVGEGAVGHYLPDARDRSDIARGLEFLRATSRFDVGQAVVIADQRVLCVEGAEGTDHMLTRFAELRCSGAIQVTGGAGVLVKAPKTGQERRIDLPSIGPRTIENARTAGLKGIAVVADSTIIAEPDDVSKLANSAKLFVVGVRDEAAVVIDLARVRMSPSAPE